MTTLRWLPGGGYRRVVEASRLEKHDNFGMCRHESSKAEVVEASRLEKHDNYENSVVLLLLRVVEASRLEKYDNSLYFFSISLECI